MREVGSIRPEPVGGGLGVYGQLPDRTVSGNDRIVEVHRGVNARKKCSKSGENITKHFVLKYYVIVMFRRLRTPARGILPAKRLLFNDERATLPLQESQGTLCMMDRGGSAGEGGEESSILIPLHEARKVRQQLIVGFDRREFDSLLKLYGRMVAANEWRDYAIDHLPDRAIFSVYRRASEAPLFQIVKNPALARKQGAFAVIGANGAVLKRGHELFRVLAVFDKTLKLVKG